MSLRTALAASSRDHQANLQYNEEDDDFETPYAVAIPSFPSSDPPPSYYGNDPSSSSDDEDDVVPTRSGIDDSAGIVLADRPLQPASPPLVSAASMPPSRLQRKALTVGGGGAAAVR